jgi:hypothetical protein
MATAAPAAPLQQRQQRLRVGPSLAALSHPNLAAGHQALALPPPCVPPIPVTRATSAAPSRSDSLLRAREREAPRRQVQDFALDPALTFGKAALTVELRAGPDPLFSDRDRGFHLLPPAWVEAGWWVLSVPPPLPLPDSDPAA